MLCVVVWFEEHRSAEILITLKSLPLWKASMAHNTTMAHLKASQKIYNIIFSACHDMFFNNMLREKIWKKDSTWANAILHIFTTQRLIVANKHSKALDMRGVRRGGIKTFYNFILIYAAEALKFKLLVHGKCRSWKLKAEKTRSHTF